MSGPLGLGSIERSEMEAVQALNTEGFGVEPCYCQMGDHEWCENALGRAGQDVLDSLDDPGDLRDSYAWERYQSMQAAVKAHAQGAGDRLLLARDGEEMLGAASFAADVEVADGGRELVVTNLGTTGNATGVGRALLNVLGDTARRLERALTLHSSAGAEGFYAKMGLAGGNGGSWRWEIADLPNFGDEAPAVSGAG